MMLIGLLIQGCFNGYQVDTARSPFPKRGRATDNVTEVM